LRAPGETKSNVEIFRLLAERMGFGDECFTDTEDEMIRATLASDSPYLRGITLERLEEEKSIRLTVSPSGDPFLPFASGGFRTKSGKFEFGAESLAYTPPEESRWGDASLAREYPFELISAKNDDSMNSTFGHRGAVDRQTSILSIHPLDAESRGIVEGIPVEVFNGRGTCFFEAQFDAQLPRRVLRARSVRWNKLAPGHSGVNRLTSERLTDLGGGPTFYSCLVDVRPS
jgi:anaerobic selenocysteine-containing dehydrogenase